MTQFSPSPTNPYVPNPTRTRLRWDNLAVLCAALAVLGGITTTIMSQASSKPKPAPAAAPQAIADPSTLPTVDGDATTITAATLEDALSLVSEAREFTSEGRWEEAADRLASIDASMRPATDADVAQRELDAAQASWNRLDAQLQTQVAGKAWAGAATTLDQLAELAPLSEDQLLLQDRVDAALAPSAAAVAAKATATAAAKPATAAKPAATAAATAAPAATGGGAAATTTKPAAAVAKPTAATTTKPAANTGSTATVGGITITMPTGAAGGSGQAADAAAIEQLLGMVATS